MPYAAGCADVSYFAERLKQEREQLFSTALHMRDRAKRNAQIKELMHMPIQEKAQDIITGVRLFASKHCKHINEKSSDMQQRETHYNTLCVLLDTGTDQQLIEHLQKMQGFSFGRYLYQARALLAALIKERDAPVVEMQKITQQR